MPGTQKITLDDAQYFLKSLSERFAQIVKISTYIQQSYGDVFDLLTEMRKILDIWK